MADENTKEKVQSQGMGLFGSFGGGLLGSLGIGAGAGLLQGIGGYLAGGEQRKNLRADRRRRDQLFGMLRGQLWQPGITPGQINALGPQIQRGLTPSLNQFARGASRRLGLGSGVAQGEIARFGQGQLQGMLGGLQGQALFANQQRQQNLLRLLTSLGG